MPHEEGRRRSRMVAGRRARNAVVVRFARGTALVQHERQSRHRDGEHRGKRNACCPDHRVDYWVQPLFTLGRARICR